MSDPHKVQVEFREERRLMAEITVDLDEVREWLAESLPPGSSTPEVTGELVREFLESGDQELWLATLSALYDYDNAVGEPEVTGTDIEGVRIP
jgi:hypothetical protein